MTAEDESPEAAPPDDKAAPSIATGDLFALGSISVSLHGEPEAVALTLPWEATDSIVSDHGVSLFDALTWRRRLTPFTGREAELGAVLDWARGSENQVSARLIAGAGGSGKTRLAAEAIERLIAEGWSAGFLETGAQSGRIIKADGRSGLLLVIDYPEERPDEVVDELMMSLVDRPEAPIPIRVLLLSRRGFSAWDKYARRLGHRFGRQELVEPGPLDPDAAERVVRSAAEGLATLKGDPAPSLVGAAAWLSQAALHRLPLFAAAAGLHAVTAPGAAFELGGARLMEDLAGRELDRARGISARAGLGETTLERLLALSTLSAEGLDQATIAELHGLEIAPDVASQVLEDKLKSTPWWSRPTGGGPGRLPRLEPDRPAAAFVALAFELGGDPPSRLSGWLGPPAEASGAEFGSVLSRLAYDLSTLPRGESLALEAAALAMLRAKPGRAALFAALGFQEATRFSAGFAAGVTEILLTAEDEPERRAGLLNNLANHLSDLGRREDALAAAEEAVEIRRPLAAARPDAFAPDLAMSLNNLASFLSNLGRREEALAAAEEAVEIRRPLAAARPDAFAPDLAASLNNLANWLSNLGRREAALAAAEEAVEIRRPLAAARPDAFAPDLAASLNNLANWLSDLGRREEALAAAEEAVEIRRPLAAARPDAFAPDLAGSLNNLASFLSNLGRREEALAAAEEAVETYRPLAAARPDAFAPDLAMSLNNLANHLSNLGRREAALAAAEEAVEIRRPLAAARPDAFAPDLAASLNNLANWLSDLGRREEALAAAEEAVEIRRPLAAARPDAFAPDLAMSLNNLASFLSNLGRREEALAAAEEAVETYRPLAAARPDAFAPDLAASLNNLANILSNLGRREEALAAAEEAVETYRPLAAARPDAFAPDLAGSLNNLANRLSDLGRREEALAAAEEAVETYRPLAAARPDAFAPALATSLNNLANRLSDLGRREEALAAAEEAVETYRPLAAARPDAFAPALATSLNNLANRLSDLGRREEALAAAEEAVKTLGPYFIARPAAFSQNMATILQVYLECCGKAEREPDTALIGPIAEIFMRLNAEAEASAAATLEARLPALIEAATERLPDRWSAPWAAAPPLAADWRETGREDAASLLAPLDAATERASEGVFTARHTVERVRAANLACYPGQVLIDVQIGSPHPLGDDAPAIASALIGPSGAVFLDGTSPPIHGLNQTALKIEDAAAAEVYLRFFCRFVRGEEGPFRIIDSVDDLAFAPGVSDEDRTALAGLIKPISLEREDDKTRRYAATVVYADALFSALFSVMPDGMVEMTDEEPLATDLSIERDVFEGMYRVERSAGKGAGGR